ncbi:sensor diguanylate cyclase/phosphodiesterase, PAS, PAS and PAS domain-containing [Sulfuricella denitrificans skB26]|uniref:Sensor diguanylate cyclase/phosphodiesterase, PAS, PAS and PAS domain-containing n=1 Tax=Sulfuricella denitrificans (strain DSM 22764 / NBRC 105220 / skB26) TaxID=1163617 RepID=S6AJT6_SULDS|nr:EAL domain-containing protein [Sulfuricella denitrificans]BAN34819.1 sensor diguanylate cyclase/phosphodiesterase, PAS, PAS and PAS domain-containing [Sulfuricella denitrificans skB26]
MELIKSAAAYLAEKAKSGRLWVFVLLPVLVSVFLTESIIVFTNGSADYFWVSLITAVIATTVMVPFLYYLVSVLRETEQALSAKSLQITSILGHHKEAEQNLVQVTNYDALTGLPNRFLFLDRLGHAISRAARSDRMVAVMLLDIDNFKTINDTLGHTHGDLLLQDIADRLSRCVPEDDTLARIGGDEFVIVLEGVSEVEEIAKIAQKIVDIFSLPFTPSSQEIYVTPSMGVTIYPMDGHDSDSLLKNADAAMYTAKEYGRNHFRFYTTDMNALAIERFAMEGALRRAMEREEFTLYYQPQVDIKSGQVIGVEALLRWNHPERGLVPPGEFVPLLEENNLIIPVGEWVLRTACAQCRAWQDAGLPPLRMAVNLSARQFRQENLVEMIDSILLETGISPKLLELELTEGLLMENTSDTSLILGQFKSRGVQVAIDDFGTGYSSLSYLKRFPIDRLKIDQSFVRDIIIDSNDAAIAVAVISLGRSLGLSVIAEGVETLDQLEFLGVQKCDEYQGYHFSRPVPPEEIVCLFKPEKTVKGEG